MGVANYYKWLLKKYDNLLSKVAPTEIKYLFFDLNCAIHPAVKKNPDYTIEEMYMAVINYIEEIIHLVNPTELIYLIIDGVAPRAKIEHQRTRRHKAVLFNKLLNKNEKNDYNMISPGTEFMATLSLKLRDFYKGNEKIIINDATEPGEGEHKIFNYIRQNPTMTNIAIYGQDADLIFLSLINYCENMFLIRINLDPKDLCFMFFNVSLLREKLLETLGAPISLEMKTLIDYTFFCFFLGNDFVPNIPSLTINENGIDILISIYLSIKTQFKNEYLQDEYLIDDNYNINNIFFYKFLQLLSTYEDKLLIEITNNRQKRINNFNNRIKYLKPDLRQYEEINYVEWRTKDEICFNEPDWKKRYYSYY